MRLTRYGIREWLGSGIVAVAVIVVAVLIVLYHSRCLGISIASTAILVWLMFAAFFRSPHRMIPGNSTVILAPADGVVKDIEVVDAMDVAEYGAADKMVCIGIFLSVLDVHVNRIPADMVVKSKTYKPGKNLDARNPRASRLNESMLIDGTAEAGGTLFRIGIKQISGALARRIVCTVEPGSYWAKGKTYGMIKFGSRTELYLPQHDNIAIKVKVGDRVFAGTTIMAEIIKTI